VEGERALGHRRWAPFIDYEMLVAISIWASLFVVVLSFAMEFALLRLDPRIRAAHRL
jgi:ABC-type dipeptide/oligopeptide/nickel transport system permease component